MYSNFEALKLSVYKCKFKVQQVNLFKSCSNREAELSLSLRCNAKLRSSLQFQHYWKVKELSNVYRQSHQNCIRSRAKNGLDFVYSLKQPYRSLLIFLVGKSHCAEAVANLKEMGVCLSRLMIRQCKIHTGQKFRRCLQMYSFYSRMWGEEMTGKMISGLQKSLLKTGKGFLLSAILLMPYDWKKNNISDEKLRSSVEELNTVDALCSATVYCEDCRKRQVIDKKIHDIDYCMCNGKIGYVVKNRQYDSWEPFLERENILVWRRKHNVQSHLYSYKVFGTYDDMSLSAFMEVQLNPSFRTQWDSTALELKIIDSQNETNSDLLYWLVKFPHFFANRDYVFKRRYHVDEERKEVIIVNEIAEHDNLPTYSGVHRVKDYWSIMVFRAKNDFHEPGMSYTLTYFDNPGTSLPSAVTNFVASTAFPDFLKRVYKAAMSLQRRWINGEDVYVSLPFALRYHKMEIPDLIGPHSETESLDTPADTVSKEITSEEVGKELQSNTLDRMGSEKLSQFRIIKEAIINSNETENDSQSNVKIPLKFRKVIIDLLEAIEVIPPDLEHKTALASKIESLVDKLGLDKTSKSQLLSRLKNLKLKTQTLINEASKKKEESFKVMNEFERTKHVYDNHSIVDESAVVIIKGFFNAINEVMAANKDMRTGKGFKKSTDNENKEEFSGKDSFDSSSNTTEIKNETLPPLDQSNVDSHESINTVCACCECDKIMMEIHQWQSPWYYFPFVFSWMWPNNSTKYSTSEEFCRSCVCEHKGKTGNAASIVKIPDTKMLGGENNEANNLENKLSAPSYWFIFSSIVNSDETTSTSSPEPNLKTESKAAVEDLSENEVESNIPWYWLPVSGSVNFVSWVYSYWTKQGV